MRSRLLYTAVLIILAVIGLRIAAFVLHDPLLAYANNYDMLRIQACHDYWPASPDIVAGTLTPQAPIESYVKRPSERDFSCFPSAELAFTGLFSLTIEDGEAFSIRGLAALKGVIFFLILATLVTWLAWMSPAGGVIAALASLIVFSDPFVLLYLPTFYTEYSAVLGYVGLTLSLALLSLSRQRLALGICIFLFSILLGLSRTQHAVLPLIVLFVLVIWQLRIGKGLSVRRPGRFVLAMAASAALIVVGIQAHWYSSERNKHIRMANSTNAYLYTWLAGSDDPERTSRRLGLPEECAEGTGQSWFSKEIRKNHPCPEVFSANRVRIPMLVFLEPDTVLNVLSNSASRLRPSFPFQLGQVEGEEFGSAQGHVFSIYAYLDRLPLSVFWVLLVLVSLAPIVLFLPMKAFSSAMRRCGGAAISACLTVPVVYLVSLVGDGVADLAKHAHLTYVALPLGIAYCVYLIALGGWAALAGKERKAGGSDSVNS